MRASGARVGPRDLLRARRALAGDSEPYYALRRILCRHPEDFPAFDEAFAVWVGAVPGRRPVYDG